MEKVEKIHCHVKKNIILRAINTAAVDRFLQHPPARRQKKIPLSSRTAV